MRLPSLATTALVAIGLLSNLGFGAAPENLAKRKAPGEDPETPKVPAHYGHSFVTVTYTVSEAEHTAPVWGPHDPNFAPSCSDWILCPKCPGGYLCPPAPWEAPSPTESSLVIVPTCSSWKSCPKCRGGYKCWKPKPTPIYPGVETTSPVLTITPTCSPWKHCFNCIGGYTCPGYTKPTSDATLITPTTKPDGYPTCTDFLLCKTCPGGWVCPTVTKGSGVSIHTSDLPTCADWVLCLTCPHGWKCPTPVSTTKGSGVHTTSSPMKFYTVVITKGTKYQTITEYLPGNTGTSSPEETSSTYDWERYEEPVCTDYIVCPTCPSGYYCPTSQPGSVSSTKPTKGVHTSFYPEPECDNYVVCPECFLGYYCPTTSVKTFKPTTTDPTIPLCEDYIVCHTCPYGYYCSSPSEIASKTTITKPVYTEEPTCNDYIVCPTCSLGYYCPTSSPSKPSKTPLTTVPPCADYVVCPTCPLGYYCPTIPGVTSTPISTSTYDWISYETPTCTDYIVCPNCPQGWYCPTSSIVTPAPSTTSTYNWASYEQPTCSDYVVCPSCPLGYYCPAVSTPPPGVTPPYYEPSNLPEEIPCDDYVVCPTCALGYYCPNGPEPTTKLVPKTTLTYDWASYEQPSHTGSLTPPEPTCLDYVVCPTCPLGYSCPPVQPPDTKTYGPGKSSPSPQPCDVYVVCPECELGYSCLVSTTKETKGPYQTYESHVTDGTANPPLSNPTYLPSATIPVPEVPLCAGYVLCPTCPSGYYCASTAEPTFASSTKYGVVPTGAITSVYSTYIVPPYVPSPVCSGKTVTITETRDVYHIFDTCGPSPYLVSSFIPPTVTVYECAPVDPAPEPYLPSSELVDPIPTDYVPSIVNPSVEPTSYVPPEDSEFYTVPRMTDFSPVSLTSWGQVPDNQKSHAPITGDPYTPGLPTPTTSTTCAWKPCEGGYACETCPHKWYCPPTKSDGSIKPTEDQPRIGGE